MPPRRRRTLVPALVAFGVAITVATPARADFFGTLAVGAVAVCAIVETPFVVYDIVVGAKRQVPSTGWAAAQIATSIPQMLIAQTLLGVVDVEVKEEPPVVALALIPAIGATTLMVHASWAVSNPRVRPGLLAAGSPMIAAEMSFTVAALAHAFSGQFSSRPIGVAQIALTLPQIIAGATILRRADPAMLPTERNTWVTLTAWSSVLFAHGIASTIVGGHREKSKPEANTDPEPEPVGEPAPRPPLSPGGDPKKPPLLVPASIEVAPTMVTDGVARGPGIAVVGVF